MGSSKVSRTGVFAVKVIALGVVTAISFWFFDAALHSMLAPEARFMEEILSPSSHELLKRLILMSLILLFSLISSWRYARRLKEGRRLLMVAEEKEQKYRDLFENAGDAIFVLDNSFNYVDVNRAAVDMLGFEREDLLKKNVFDLIPNEQTAASLREFETLKQTGGYKNFQGRLITKDGMWLDVEVSSTAIEKDGEKVGSRDIVRDITERKIIMDALEQTIKEKEMLLKEIHHRAKNNLTVIQSLLYLQSTEMEDTRSRSALKESQERLASISLIHSMLGESEDVKNMKMSEYVSRLAESLVKSYGIEGREIQLYMDVDMIYLDIQYMMPCGLIINELITNAIKYAFPSGPGRLEVYFKESPEGCYVFGVRDNGVGLPEDMKFDGLTSLGIKIITTLTEQLKGSLEVIRQDGTDVRVSFRALPGGSR